MLSKTHWLIFFIFLLYFCITCKSPNNNRYSVTNLKLPADSILHVNSNNKYSIHDETLYLYNRSFNFLYQFNLKTNSLITKHQFDNSFLNSEMDGAATDIIVFRKNYFVFVQQYSIKLLDQNFTILAKTDINTDTLNPYMNMRVSDYFPSQVNQNNNLLYIQRSNLDCYENAERCCNYSTESSFIISIDAPQKINLIDTLLFVNPFKHCQDKLGYINWPSRCIVGDFHYYAYSLDDNIYSYNVKTNAVETTLCKSNNKKVEKLYVPEKPEDLMTAMITLPNYQNLLYNSSIKKFFRFFYAKQAATNEDGYYNTAQNQKMYLVVMNEKLQIEQEILLNSSVHFSNAFVYGNGICIPKINKNEKSILFDYYQF